MNSQPLVSVIIPVYNQAAFILDAINSIKQQIWKNWELIIINDGSTDSLENTLKKLDFQYHYHRQKNQGVSSARNVGIKKAKGEFIAFLDADDRWTTNHLDDLLNQFFADERISVVVGQVDDEETIQWLPSFGSALFHKSSFETTGLLDESLRYSEDQDWFLRARELGLRIRVFPKATLKRRIHQKSTTFNKSWNEVDIHHVLKMSLDRRRRQHKGSAPQLETLSSLRIESE